MSLATRTFAAPADVSRLGRKALVIGVVGALASGAGYLVDPTQFFRSYLVSWLLWLSIAMGCLAIAMLHHLSRGAWGLMIRRVLEAGASTLPLLTILFLPVILGLTELYPWARPDQVAHDEMLQHKTWWLTPGAFTLRSAFYLVFWSALALTLNRLSQRQDETGDPRLFRSLQTVAGPGILLYALTATFASVDWLMSVDAHWYSSLFGVYFIGGQGVAALSFVVILALYLAKREPMKGVLGPRHFHDYGKLMLAFVSLWAYFALSQFLIIWSGNLKEEVLWYRERIDHGWNAISLGLIFFHFVLPFVLLLSRDLKRRGRPLLWIALLLLAMRFIDLYWQAGPAFHPEGLTFHWLDLATLAGVGGLWFAAFARRLARRPLLPVNDPFLEEALGHE